MKGSAWIAALFDKWFDCIHTILRPTPNTNLLPYYSEDDARLNWLGNEFLGQLEEWKNIITETSKSEIGKKFLSLQTYTGLVMATRSTVEMVRILLRSSSKGVFVLTRRINQDPLEAFFFHK